MSKTPRYATMQDVEKGHLFVAVYITIDRNNMLIQRSGFIQPKVIGKDNVYRFGGLGAIAGVELGEVNCRSASEYNCTAFVMDYAGNVEVSIATAKEYVEQKRASYLERLQAHMAEIEATQVVVQ